MEAVDERILECLQSEGRGSAWSIAFDIKGERHRVARHCRVLAHAGFIERIPREGLEDHWIITDWGRLYLNGKVNADHRRPLPAPRPPDKVRPGWYAGFG